jgi:diadenosine tetraphosphate (Ap4A) HIT family hydrolase
MCHQGRVDEDEFGVRIFAGNVSDAYLMRRPPQPGYAVVTFRGRHVADPTEMTAEEQAAWWADIGVVARAINHVYKPCHINYEILGNAVPHTHVHLVARYLDDPAPGRPLPNSSWQAAAELTNEELEDQTSALRSAVSQNALSNRAS